jgi:choline dehydrogenase-like flavoprotein
MSDAGVIVVGTGATASVVARHFAALGQKVLMLERGVDRPYAPKTDMDRWQEATSDAWEDGRLITRNQWTGLIDGRTPTYQFSGTVYDDLAMIENLRGEWGFRYNMRLGYGGSSAVWSGRTWRLYDSDFSTRSSFGYGLDWPVSGQEMKPFYDQAEELMGVSGPQASDDWRPDGNYQYEAFAPTYLDGVVSKIFAEDFDIYPTANAVKRAHPLEGGCVAAKTCVSFCPSNALFRHYQLLDPLRESGAVEVVGDRIVSAVEVDGDGYVSAIRYNSRSGGEGRLEVTRNQRVFLCGNTIENLRILLNSGRISEKKIANQSGLLGAYFGTHGAAVRELTTVDDLKIGRGRPSTSAGLTRDLGTNRREIGAYMLELWNMNWLNGNPRVVLERMRQQTGTFGREFFDRAKVLPRQAPASIIFEIELRERNRIKLSQQTDNWGVPVAQVDFEMSERDLRTYEHIQSVFERAAANPGCEDIRVDGQGLNGNHPVGGYVMGTSPTKSVTDLAGRAHGHPNLFVMGGGLFCSTSAFNPTLTITANTLRCLSRIGTA